MLGFNASLTAPRKFGCLGTHPTDTFAQQYGDDSWFCAGVATPRGTVMESDTIFSLDFSMAFDMGSVGIIKESLFKIDIFNVLGQDGVDDLYIRRKWRAFLLSLSILSITYFSPYPRSIRLGIEAKFNSLYKKRNLLGSFFIMFYEKNRSYTNNFYDHRLF